MKGLTMRRFAAAGVVCLALTACSLLPQTTKNQVRGTVPVTKPAPDKLRALEDLHGDNDVRRARQIMAEHSSIEYYKDFSLGIMEVLDDGTIDPIQKKQVFDMLKAETDPGGLLVVFVHGWHHGARTCDRDLCCFRTVLSKLKKSRDAAYEKAVEGQNVVGVFIGWRGESRQTRHLNTATIWNRKDVAETLGRSSAKELLLEIKQSFWEPQEDLTMISVGHSLGGALLFQAAKETLTGNISDIEEQKVRSYRIARADCDREPALAAGVKARRLGFGDLVLLVNPALEANEYTALDADLFDATKEGWSRDQLIKATLPYDKNRPYPDNQLPVLVAIASLTDSAVGTIFPLSRVAIFPHKPSILTRADERLGIGHYQPHVTHHLGYEDAFTEADRKERDPRAELRKNCDCSMLSDAPNMEGAARLDLQKADQTFGRDNKYTLKLTDERRRRGWDLNSPYWVIEAEPKIMAEHSDIFNPYFVGFLTHFMDAYYTKFERLQKAAGEGKKVSDVCKYDVPLNTIVGGGAAARATASAAPHP
jgi:hypothetical protein